MSVVLKRNESFFCGGGWGLHKLKVIIFGMNRMQVYMCRALVFYIKLL